jgi:hypothetical protein
MQVVVEITESPLAAYPVVYPAAVDSVGPAASVDSVPYPAAAVDPADVDVYEVEVYSADGESVDSVVYDSVDLVLVDASYSDEEVY